MIQRTAAAALAAASTLPADGDWREEGLCCQIDPESFFPEKGGSSRRAKEICMSCPVRPTCLQTALENQEPFGVWGGLSAQERRDLLQERGGVLVADGGSAA